MRGEVEEGAEAEQDQTGQCERLLLQQAPAVVGVGEALSDGVLVQQVILQLLLSSRLIFTDMTWKAVVKSLGYFVKSHIFFGHFLTGQHPDIDWD